MERGKQRERETERKRETLKESREKPRARESIKREQSGVEEKLRERKEDFLNLTHPVSRAVPLRQRDTQRD